VSRINLYIFLAITSGLLIAFLLPTNLMTTGIGQVVWLVGDIVVRFFGYLARPLFFFSVALSVAYLGRHRKFWSVVGQAFLLGAFFSFLFSILGALVALTFPTQRIVISLDQEILKPLIEVHELAERIIPHNIFVILLDNWFFPLFFLATLIGLNLLFDHESIEPTFNLFDSLSRVFYNALANVIKFVFIPAFLLAYKLGVTFRTDLQLSQFYSILRLASISTFVLVFGLLTLLYSWFVEAKKPFNWLKGGSGALGFSLINTLDIANYVSYSYFSHHHQRIKRDLAGMQIPLFMLFFRAGIAFMVSMSMVIILKSYSTLEISFGQLMVTVLASFVASFFITSPASTTFAQAMLLTAFMYGRGIEGGLRVLDSVVPYLSVLANFIDIAVLMFCLNLLARKHDFLQRGVVVKTK
jgi:aerobic C4-dicarboxylate transport protein